MNINSKNLTDIGFEVCTPISLISDKLIHSNIPNLTSLRIWNSNRNDEKSAITDKTFYEIAK